MGGKMSKLQQEEEKEAESNVDFKAQELSDGTNSISSDGEVALKNIDEIKEQAKLLDDLVSQKDDHGKYTGISDAKKFCMHFLNKESYGDGYFRENVRAMCNECSDHAVQVLFKTALEKGGENILVGSVELKDVKRAAECRDVAEQFMPKHLHKMNRIIAQIEYHDMEQDFKKLAQNTSQDKEKSNNTVFKKIKTFLNR